MTISLIVDSNSDASRKISLLAGNFICRDKDGDIWIAVNHDKKIICVGSSIRSDELSVEVAQELMELIKNGYVVPSDDDEMEEYFSGTTHVLENITRTVFEK